MTKDFEPNQIIIIIQVREKILHWKIVIEEKKKKKKLYNKHWIEKFINREAKRKEATTYWTRKI